MRLPMCRAGFCHDRSVKVVVGGRGDPYVVEVPAQQAPFVGRDEDFLIDFGRVVLRASDVEVALPRVDQQPFGASHAAAVGLERESD